MSKTKMSYEEILKENGNKRLDVCLMNPPYAGGTHERFLYKVLQISEKVITVQPDSYLFKGKNGNAKIKEILNNGNTNIESIDANKYFDTYMQQRVAILKYINSNDKKIIYNGHNLEDLNNIDFRFGDDLIIEFKNNVKELLKNNCGNKWKGTSNSHYPDRIIKNEDENQDAYVVNCSLLRGHPNSNKLEGKDDDFYTLIPANKKLIDNNFIGKYKDLISKTYKNKPNKTILQYYFKFNSEQEAKNFINYLQTDFARCCLYLKKNDMNIRWDCIPWFDFSDEHFSKSPREIDDWLFKKYNISDEIRKHIEEILPDYYNIR